MKRSLSLFFSFFSTVLIGCCRGHFTTKQFVNFLILNYGHETLICALSVNRINTYKATIHPATFCQCHRYLSANSNPRNGQRRTRTKPVCETERNRGRVIERETDRHIGGRKKRGKSRAPVLERDRPSEKARECVHVRVCVEGYRGRGAGGMELAPAWPTVPWQCPAPSVISRNICSPRCPCHPALE